MAFGLSPKHSKVVSLNGISKEDFLTLAIEAAKALNWNISQTTKNGFIAFTEFSMSSWSEEIKLEVDEESIRIKSECTGNQLVDWGKNKKNIEELTETIDQLKTQYTANELTAKSEELQTTLSSESLSTVPTSGKEKLTGFLSIFKPVNGYYITPVVININILVFILMAIDGIGIFDPDNQGLIRWGANFRPVTLDGESWRLITACFVHIGLFHLLMNMYALLYIGLLLEPYLGKFRFSAAYLLTGVAASVTSLWWHDSDLTISAGASGAVFGMYGVFLALLTSDIIDRASKKTLLSSIGIFVGYNLLNGMKGGIDNAAHIGGLISGLIIGYVFIPSLKKPATINYKYISVAVVAIVTLTASYFVYGNMPNTFGDYDKKMEHFPLFEKKALQVYELPENAGKQAQLRYLKDTGLLYWNKSIMLLKDACKIENLPQVIIDRNSKLIKYCELRIKTYEFIYKAISEDTDIYNDSVGYYNKQIETILNGLSIEK
jgi:rhomboid protease GluP